MTKKLVTIYALIVLSFFLAIPTQATTEIPLSAPFRSLDPAATPIPEQTTENSFAALPLQAQPTRVRPTATPLKIPPPADPRVSTLIIGFGVFSVVIVIFGIWLNRKKVFPPTRHS